MKAIQIEDFNAPCTVSGIDNPKSKPPQLLIQIEAGEFCHTYCMAFGNAYGSKLPFIGPHEPAGVVVEVGSEVPGITTDGAWAEYMAADTQFTVKLPDSLDFPTAACMMCAGITMYGGIKRAQNAIFRDIKRIGSLVADKDATEELLELVVKHNIQVKIGEWKPDDAEKIRQEYLSGKVDMAAKLRSKRCQEQTSVKQWLIDNQLGICLGILAPLLIAQCNGLTRPLTANLTSLSYRDEFTGEYGVGFDDNYLVAVLIVVLTGLRDATMRFVLDPLAAAWGLGRARSMRFKEQAWMVVYYATCWSVGTYIYASSSYWLDLQAMWTNWPNREISGLMKIYMLAQLAFWLQQMIVINIEKRRKDHWQMLSHHIVTIALVYCSYRYGLTRVGNVVLILMDFNDLVFSIAKCLKYMKLQSLCDFMFGSFVVSWVLCRHTAFPMVCWSVYAHSLAITGPNCFVGSGKNIIGPQEVPADGYFYLLEPLIYTNGRVCYDYTIKTLFVSGLLFLEALMLVWFVMIVKLVIRVLRGGNAEDTRSDNEEEEYEEGLPIKIEVDAEKLQFPKKHPSGGRGTPSVFQSARGKAQPIRHTSATRPGSMSSCILAATRTQTKTIVRRANRSKDYRREL
ncbi:hypothetical protein FANTH_14139 [Fusarium anthophilum]|uniref:TLC domain-containing protein n=1 Tax=Fusarium anthophilum TaxID=48485 RepID=A0A8H4YJX5_9HYPO|nr:hypothetical protein FANTH_14139 [Fusarium anthophilum]